MKKYQLFIDGKFVDAESGATRASMNPATEEPVAEVAVAGRADARRAVEATRKAFDARTWSGMPVKERVKILLAMVERLQARVDELAALESADAGATIRKTTLMDIPIGVCAGIIPWNLPFMMAAWKIAPRSSRGTPSFCSRHLTRRFRRWRSPGSRPSAGCRRACSTWCRGRA